jgi:hypothetical protein
MAYRLPKAGLCDYEVSVPAKTPLSETDGSTLFWAGSTYAPSFIVDGPSGGKVNIQEYLQGAFLSAVQKLNEAVGDLDGVLGIEVSATLACQLG